ncbi:MAG: D-glycero-beta-D-manno-heptose 1-phosphate adenylyltransferase [Acidiferrobacteraceae bacterium]|nr:D-glycero-beta-D-manno-heptose 1-phosphate adenylyltransferase [Acidiferrobacteraceae bacterium]
MNSLQSKIVSDPDQIKGRVKTLQTPRVFTNGCFDILHRGHITTLIEAAQLGNSLIVGVNSDSSVRDLNKGRGRPINALEDRLALIAALEMVDLVVGFDEETPLNLINLIRPDYLVKGGDWAVDRIVGAAEVASWGGKTHTIPFKTSHSTTSLIEKICNNCN